MNNFGEKISFIWSVADLLRGPYKPPQYGRVILPLTILRRLDCVLAPTKAKILAKVDTLKGSKVENVEPILNRISGVPFHNTSKLDFEKLKGEPDKIAANLTRYIKSFSDKARDMFDSFGFEAEIAKLDEANRLYLVVSKFCDIDLHPGKVPNIEMGYIFEELIRKFNEAANETAGDHFTPREVIRLMVNLLFAPDNDILTKKGILRTMLDPACGTGGMLSISTEYLHELNPDARLEAFGQDWNKESYAVCGSDMLIKGQNVDHIVHGSSFSKDGFAGQRFDYMLANPPFGVEWKADEDFIVKEHETQGHDGRFGAGLPRINDGSFLFLQHMISKMKPVKEGGTRLGIVFNGSPLFTGGAGGGESEIRRRIIEHDWLEAIVALPDQLFYNTGIFTYIWIVTNRKSPERRGKVQLINAVDLFSKMRKSLGNKRNEIATEHIAEITRIYGEFGQNERSKIFDNADFGYRQVIIERPLRLNFKAAPERTARLSEQSVFQNLAKSKKKGKAAEQEIAEGKAQQETILATLSKLDAGTLYKNRDEFCHDLDAAFDSAHVKLSPPIRKAILAALSERDEMAEICRDNDGKPEPDPELRDCENVPFKQDVTRYFEQEVKPHAPDAWINEADRDEADGKVGRMGYDIPFTRHFYQYAPPRSLDAIETDIAGLEKNIIRLIQEVVGSTSYLDLTCQNTPNIKRPEAKFHLYASTRASRACNMAALPQHWAEAPLSTLACLNASKLADTTNPDFEMEYVDIGNVDLVAGITSSEHYRFEDAPSRARRRLINGDTIISTVRTYLKAVARISDPPENLIASTGFAVLSPNSKCDPGFLYRLVQSEPFVQKVVAHSVGVSYPAINAPELRKFLVPVPPLGEQRSVAMFLDRETTRVDRLIAGIPQGVTGSGELSRLVALLQEYRSALITAAVTGRIDVRQHRGEA